MKPTEILSSLPIWANASADDLLASPAWTMPCRLGEQSCTLRLDAPRPAETLDLLVRFGDEEHILGICDCPSLPELHAVWAARAEMPEPLLLALVEKDCGPLFQLLENAVRRQLGIVGLSASAPGPDAKLLSAQVRSSEGEAVVSFSLTSSPAIVSALGQLRFIDVANPAVRDGTLSAEVEYATFSLPAADLAALAPGDALLLPEIGTMSPRKVVESRLAVGEGGVTEWKDEGTLRVVAPEPVAINVGELIDLASSDAAPSEPAPLPANTPLRLVRLGKTLATGRLDSVGAQQAFVVDDATPL